MGGFIKGGYADITDYSVSEFRVERLAGREANSSEPRWEICCTHCGDTQVLPHRKIMPLIESNAAQNLRCANGACPLSRTQARPSETLAELRAQERKQAEEAARAAAEAQRQSEISAAQRQAEASRQRAIQREYIEYVIHQWGAGQSDDKLIPKQRFAAFSADTRQKILDIVRRNPGALISGN
jgi:phage gpG-like protein